MAKKKLTISVVSNPKKIQISVSPPVLKLSKADQDQVVILSDKDVTVQFKHNGRGPLTRNPGAGGYKPEKNKSFAAGKVRSNAMKKKYGYSVIYVEPASKLAPKLYPKYVYTLDPRFWVY